MMLLRERLRKEGLEVNIMAVDDIEGEDDPDRAPPGVRYTFTLERIEE